MNKTTSTLKLFLIALAVFIFNACGGSGTDPTAEQNQPPQQTESGFYFSAAVANTNVNVVVVEVTASDIPQPLIFNIYRDGDRVEGIIHVAAGSDRFILVHAYDDNGIETHRGDTTVDIFEGLNPAVYIALYPLIGDVPIDVIIECLTVSITPGDSTLGVGETLQLAASVTDGDGNPVAGSVSWGSTAPFIASISPDGLVTALREGTTEIVANYANVRASILITVGSGAPPSGEILGPVYPPPGGVTFNSNGQMGSGTGVFFYFTDFDLSQVATLAWGTDTSAPILLAMDGMANDPGETLIFNSTDSDFANGIMRFTGSTNFTYQDPGTLNFVTETLDTRLTVHVYDGQGNIPLADVTDPEINLAPEIGGIAPVNENYPTGGTNSPMTVNLLMEAFFNGSWQPVDDVFTSQNTPPTSEVVTSFLGGFYYQESGGQTEPPNDQVLGPVLIPPGGVTLVTSGIPGIGTGFFYRYNDFDISATSGLAWGAWLGENNAFAFDGAVDAPGEFLQYDAAASNLNNGVMRLTGEAVLTYFPDGGTGFVDVLVPTRMTLTVTNNSGPVMLVPAADAGLPAELGAIAPVSENYPTGGTNGAFTVNLLMEVFFEGAWQPALDLYNGLNTPPVDNQVITDFYEGFYYLP